MLLLQEKCSNNYREGSCKYSKEKVIHGCHKLWQAGSNVVDQQQVVFPIILAEGKCMVENADSRPLIGRPSFDSTPLLIENRRSRRSSSSFTQFNFTAIQFLCAGKGLLLIFTAQRRSGGAVADGFEKRPFLCLMLGLTFGY